MINRYPDRPGCGVRLDAEEDQKRGEALDLDARMFRGKASLWVRSADNEDSAAVYLNRRDLIALRNGINHILDQED